MAETLGYVYCIVMVLMLKGYIAQSLSLDDMKTIITCQGSKVRIRCKNSKIIMVFDASYGRTVPGDEICNSSRILTTSCTMGKGNALRTVEKRCSNRSRCNVKADSSMFRPDPCPGTFKYMTITYWCRKRPKNMSTRPPSTRKKRKKTTPTPHLTTSSLITLNPTNNTNISLLNTTYYHNISYTNNTGPNITMTTPLVMAAVKTDTVEVAMTTSLTTTARPAEKSGYVKRGQPKYVLILFLSGVAVATVLLLVLLLGLHIRGRRSKKFIVQSDKPLSPDIDDDEDDGLHDDDSEDDDDDDDIKNVTIEIQDGNEETKQISVRAGDIIIIDSKDVDNDDSEDLGYMSEIVRYYNSRNMVHDDGKQSLTCETPSVNSIPNSDSDKREMPYETVRPANGVCVI